MTGVETVLHSKLGEGSFSRLPADGVRETNQSRVRTITRATEIQPSICLRFGSEVSRVDVAGGCSGVGTACGSGRVSTWRLQRRRYRLR